MDVRGFQVLAALMALAVAWPSAHAPVRVLPASAAEQPPADTACPRRQDDCPWALNAGANTSCLGTGPNHERRWRCWKVVAR